MKNLFIIAFFALLIPAVPAMAQCGDCQAHYEIGKGPGEVYYGQTIQGFITSHLSPGGNMRVPVGVSMSDGSQAWLTCESSLSQYVPMQKATKCLQSNQYVEVTLYWEAGTYAIISGTWIPGHYNIIGWRVMQIQ